MSPTNTSIQPVASPNEPILPDSTAVGVVLSIIAAIVVYSIRQYWEKKKLKRALIQEVSQMEGIEKCANHMEQIDPPAHDISPDDVPAAASIPTTVYESSAQKIGLLGGLLSGEELEQAIEFYSEVLRYRGIIAKIGDGQDVSDSDLEDLYDSISDLAERRSEIISNSSFDI